MDVEETRDAGIFGEVVVKDLKWIVTVILVLDLINQVKTEMDLKMPKNQGIEFVLFLFYFKVIWGVILAVNNYQVILFTSICNHQENLLHQGALLVPLRAHLCEECMRLLSLLSRERRHLVRHQLVTVSGDYLCATAGYIFC